MGKGHGPFISPFPPGAVPVPLAGVISPPAPFVISFFLKIYIVKLKIHLGLHMTRITTSLRVLVATQLWGEPQDHVILKSVVQLRGGRGTLKCQSKWKSIASLVAPLGNLRVKIPLPNLNYPWNVHKVLPMKKYSGYTTAWSIFRYTCSKFASEFSSSPGQNSHLNI